MNANYFSRQAARALIGRCVKSQRAWSTVPVGTTGTVKWIDEAEWNAYGVVVQWDTGDGITPQLDTLTRTEYQSALTEINPTLPDGSGLNAQAA